MILLIGGASHSGKTRLALEIAAKTGWFCLSMDLLKMGLIRSGRTTLGPESPDGDLVALLWPIAREMIKTAVENEQNLIVEGCYIPFDWKSGFAAGYLRQIRHLFIVMSAKYIRAKFADIAAYANVAEKRLADCLAPDDLLRDNLAMLRGCQLAGLNYLLIDESYPTAWGLELFA